MPKIGLKKAYYAVMSADVADTSVTYNVPVSLQHVQQAQVNPKVSRIQIPGDDVIIEDITECHGADGSIQRDEFLPSEEAVLLGRPVDANGGVYGGTTDNPPYVAFGYMRTFKKSNTALYVWLLKVKFAPTNSTADTKPTDNITPQYDTMSFSAITREADGQWIYSIKSDDPDFADTFFTQATLQALANTISQIYTKPANVSSVAELPAMGVAGTIYHLSTDDSFYYWDGSDFEETE